MKSFEEEIKNLKQCIVGNNSNTTVSMRDQADKFVDMLPAIIRSACVLAVYAGEDYGNRPYAYGFGADSYDYLDKYVEGGMKIAVDFGTDDFYNYFDRFFEREIYPSNDRESRLSAIAKENEE